jgi:hypothetical protein
MIHAEHVRNSLVIVQLAMTNKKDPYKRLNANAYKDFLKIIFKSACVIIGNNS